MQRTFATAVLTLALTCSVSVSAQEDSTANSPRVLYQMGAASEAALRCRGFKIVDKGSQAEAYRDAKAKSISSRAMVMGIEDFEKEFSTAYAKGLEQGVCDKYLRRYPSLLTRR